MLKLRSMLPVLLAATAAVSLPGSLNAQGYPDKPITLIVPFAAGGPSDTIGRLVADHLGRKLGQQLVVENVGGAGGTLGAERAAKAAPTATRSSHITAGCPPEPRSTPTCATTPRPRSSRWASSTPGRWCC